MNEMKKLIAAAWIVAALSCVVRAEIPSYEEASGHSGSDFNENRGKGSTGKDQTAVAGQETTHSNGLSQAGDAAVSGKADDGKIKLDKKTVTNVAGVGAGLYGGYVGAGLGTGLGAVGGVALMAFGVIPLSIGGMLAVGALAVGTGAICAVGGYYGGRSVGRKIVSLF